MNILHVIPGDLWAGAEAQVYHTVKKLCEIIQHNVSVITFCNGELYKRLLDLDIDVTLLDEKILNNAALCKAIKNKLDESKIHIIHTHEYKSHILSALAKLMSRNNKCILYRTQHGQNSPNKIKSYFIFGAEYFFLRYITDDLIAVSSQLEKLLLKKATKANIHLIYNAINPPTLPLHPDVSEIRNLFGIRRNQFWIGTAARLETVKNISMLIDAAKFLKRNHQKIDFRVSIFGEGALREVLNSQISKSGLNEYVFLEGHNNNIMPVLQALDVFTLTSLHEGLPMSLLEAMSVGTIPVCTAVGGMKEVIIHNKDGFLVSPADAKGLADIYAFIYGEGSKLNPLREKAIEKIKNNYSIEKNYKNLLSLYKNSYNNSR